ncbi:MAG: type I restriction-modification enzyme R subunit C-terminal domain-containing protein [Sciscionella sp.]
MTLPMLETMRRRVRALVKLIEKTKRGVIYTDFADEIGDLAPTELKNVNLGTNKSRFEAKVRTYLRTHEDQLAVQKIRRNRQITDADLRQLEQVFLGAGFGTQADIDAATSEAHGLGLFLRSITGLEREAANAAFDAFQSTRTLTANQLDFVNLAVDVVAKNGIIGVDLLYDRPFTALAPSGPEDIFAEADVVEITTVLDAVRDTAIPAERSA